MKKNHSSQDYTQWNLPEGVKTRLGKGWINDIAYSPDGRLLAVASSIGIWLYDAGTGQELDLLAKSKSNVTSVAFSPDGFTLASVTSWDEICLWDVSNGVGRTLYHYQSNYQLNSSHEYWREISSITFSPDGTTLAIGTMDFAIHLCNVATGTHIKTLAPPSGGPRSSVLSVAFSDDGQTIASGNLGEINLWCAKTGTRKTIKERPPDSHAAIESIAFSPDNAILATGSRFAGLMGSRSKEGTVRLWDAKTGTYLKTLDGHTLSINSIAFAANNNILASGSMDGTLRLWDAKTGTCLKTFTGDTSSVESVAFSPDGTTVASAYYSGTVRLWDVKTGKSFKTIAGHNTSSINSMTFSPDGTTVASGHSIGTVRLWDATTGKSVKALTGHTSSVNSIAFSGNGRLIASGGADKIVRVWNAETGQLRYSLTGLIEPIDSTIKSLKGTFSPNSRLIATICSGSYYNATHVWDAETGQLKSSLDDQSKNVVFSPNSRLIASGGADKIVRVWNAETGQLRYSLNEHTNTVWSVVFSPNSRLIASTDGDGRVCVWNAETGQLRHTIDKHREYNSSILFNPFGSGSLSTVWSVVFSPNSRLITSADRDGTVYLWDAETGQLRHSLNEHTNTVWSVVFSPNSRLIASADSDETVCIWNVETGQLRHSLNEHTDKVQSITFSPNSGLIVNRSDDGPVRVWDVETGQLRHTFDEHTVSAENMSFSPDGRILAIAGQDGTIAGQDGTVLLWDVDFLQNKDILTEENRGFLNSESRIQQICEERGITTLIHFTRIENLQSILREGLLGRETLEKRLQEGLLKLPKLFINDHSRWDKHKEAVCLSISFPNHLMFSSIRKQKMMSDGISDSGWVVLVLDAKVLWELDCVFCTENAASNVVRHDPLEERRKPDVLEGMFVDTYRDTKGNVYERQSLQIPNHYPTHPQAEVLVFDQIPSDYIKEVHFYDETILKQWCDNNPWINPERLLHNQQYFQYGRDQVVWQDDNLDDDIPPAPPLENDNLDDVIPF